MEVDRQIFIAQRQVVYNMIYDAKAKYYRDKISSCSDQKELFKIVESLLHQKGKAKLPSHHSKEELAEKFNNFFISKITKYAMTLIPSLLLVTRLLLLQQTTNTIMLM